MNDFFTKVCVTRSKSILSALLFFAVVFLMPRQSMAQINIALTATASHGTGGATGTPDYSAVNYNDNNIVSVTGCSDATTPWGWINTGQFIQFTWTTPQTFDKIVLYKSNRPMTSCDIQYWNGTAFVTIMSWTTANCPQDSITFSPVTSTILRLNNCQGTNPNHREIKVIQSVPMVVASPTSVAFGNVTIGATSPTQVFSVTGTLLTSSPITVGTSSSNFEFSFNGTTWFSTPQPYPFTVPGFTSVPIYVRFSPTALTTYSGNITFSGSGLASTFNVPLTGTGVNACTATPAPGTASITPGTGATATPFTLSLSGTTAVGGLTYQWQSAPTGTGVFTNITGATNSTYGFTGISANTFYQAVVTCPSFAPATSNTVAATFIPTPACVTVGGTASWTNESSYAYGVGVFSVTAAVGPSLGDNTIMASVNTSTGYLNRTSLTPITLYRGYSYPGSLSYGTVGTYQYSQVWIDFDDNGTFSTSEEVTPLITAASITTTNTNPKAFTITIPAGANIGSHLMRVRGIWESIASTLGAFPAHMDPCNVNYGGSNPQYFSGTCVDYFVNIQNAPPAVVATSTSLAFGNITVSTPSAAQVFSVTGTMLTSSPITVGTTNPNFEFSFNGTTWFSTAQPMPFTVPGFANVPIYVRLVPTALTAYTGNITFSGSGLAATYNIAVSGTGVNACSGTPDPGTASVTPASGGGTSVFTLSLAGTSAVGGLTYQWQQSSTSSGPYTNISAATSASYSFSGLSANTYYQALVTCPTFTPATSNNVLATFLPAPSCVTTGGTASWTNESSYSYGVGIFTVTAAVGSNLVDNSIMSSVNTSTGYLNRTTLPPVTLYKANVYPASVSYGTLGSYQYSQVWIDFNNDGVFSISEEVTPLVTAATLTSTNVNPVNFTINIPSGVLSGIHLMRVRGIWESIASTLGVFPAHMDPCNVNYGGSNPQYFSGTCVDYYVDIEDAPPCTGMPTAGTITPSVANGCTAFTSNMILTGASGASGITYQWFSSPDNVTFTPVAGALGNTYSTGVTASIYYKASLTCVASGQTATTPAVFLSLPAITYATVPYLESFESSWLSVCNTADAPNNSWRNSPATGNNSWRREDDGGSPAAPGPNTAVWGGPTSGFPASAASDGLHSARYHSWNTTTPGTLDLYINLPAGTKQINYDYINASTGAGNVQLKISVDGGATFINIGTPHSGPTGWTTFTETTTLTAPNAILRWVATGDFSTDIELDNVSVFVQTPCTTPAAQPTAMVLTPAMFTVAGTFTAPVPAPHKYLTVVTTTNVAPAMPVNGTNYAVGSAWLGGVVVANSSTTTFNATGLTPGTHYWFWTYAYNSLCTGGPLYSTAAPLTNDVITNSCSLSGIKTVGPTGDFATITAALANIYTNGLAGPLALELQTTYTGVGETYPIAINNIPCASATNTLTIRPQGTMTITYGAGTQPFIDLNGADYVIIDGRVGSTGTTKALTISATNTGAQAIRFTNDASYNTVKYCTITSINTSTVQGSIFFYITAGTTGNDYNTIDNCDILDGTSTPVNAIYSSGTTGKENDHNTISNCNIANYFSPSSSTNGIYLSTANTDWTIINNRFYQTASRTFTSGTTHRAIQISNTAGNNFQVLNNTIGFASNTGTGTYTLGGSVSTTFLGITLSVGNVIPSSVQGNTISGINLTTTSTSSTSGGALCGISITSGSANIGTITPNVIGAATGNGALTLTPGSLGTLVGINSSTSSPAIVNIQNNIIGSMTAIGTATAGASVNGIQISSSASLTVSGNSIGSATTANSLYSSFNTTSAVSNTVYGINSAAAITPIVPWVIANNTINNLTNAATSSSSLTGGIVHTGTANGSITGNIIQNISSATTNTVVTGSCGVMGIAVFSSTQPVVTISQNTISGLSNTNNTAIATSVCGIGTTNAPGIIINRNKIYDLRNANTGTTATAPPRVIGVLWVSPSTTGPTITNNMISLGNGQTTNTSFAGIMNGATTTLTANIYFNTVNIEGTAASGALPTAAFIRGNFTGTAFTTPIDARNNIFINTRTGGTGKHYAIANNLGGTASATGWGANASNYNILNGNAATIGYWSADKTFATWKTASLSDNNSYTASTVTFANSANGDLHINMGTTANNVESHGTNISGFNTDYDNQNRPGPTSVNGGGFAPDLGADEFDGNPLENLPPVINYTALLNGCGTGNRTFTVNLVDPSGVPTGATAPRVYYKKGASGTWFSTPGTLSSGSVQNGTWSFTILASDMGGLALADQVYYYVIAQDVPGNVISNPSAGLVATNVNTITTPPTTPFVYSIIPTMGGSYNVGTGGDYATITAAVAAYNTSCLTGPVIFNLTNTAYNTAETFPIVINANPYGSAVNTLTIRPATGVAATISGLTSSTSIFKLLNANYVTLDGVNTGGSSLAITANNTGANAVIWLASGSAGPGNNFITLKNLNITGGTSTGTTSSWAILSGIDAASPTSTAGMDNDNITIQGNTFKKAAYGIYAFGTATVSAGALDNWVISGNTFGPATYSTTDNLGYNGMWLGSMVNPLISGNTIQNVGNTTLSSQTLGIGLSGNVNGATITGNNIHDITCNYSGTGISSVAGIYLNSNVLNTTISRNTITRVYNNYSLLGGGARGISVSVNNSNSNTLIANNNISDIKCYGYTIGNYPYCPAGIDIISFSGGIKVYYNSINMNSVAAGYNIGTSSFCLLTNSTASNIDVRNNIFVNTYNNTTVTSDKGYAIYCPVSSAVFSNLDYNDYYVAAPNVLAGLGTTTATMDKPTLADIQTAFGGNTHSISVSPVFVSPSDLHLQLNGANLPLDAGIPLSVTTDFDGTTRSNTVPVIGSHELNMPACNTVAAGVPIPVNPNLCVSGSTAINLSGASFGTGLTYQWYSSADSVNWTAINGATSAAYTIAPAIGFTTFYRAVLNCTLTGSKDSSVTKVRVNPMPNITIYPDGGAYCSGSSLTMSAAGAVSYTWSPATSLSATSGAVVTTNTSTNIPYTITGVDANGCVGTHISIVSVTATPGAATVTAAQSTFCSGSSTQLTASASVANFTWSPIADLYTNAALTIPYTGGNATTVYAAPTAPLVPATRVYTVTVTNGACTNNQGTKTLVINPLPANNTGNHAVCAGLTTTLANAVTGGTWSSSSPNVTVAAATGVVTGITAGTANITYTLGTGCNRISVVTINPLPAAISGNADVCIAATNMLSNATLGGTWSSGNTAVATINTIGGLTGVAAGLTPITYTLSTGCISTVVATVNVLPVLNVTPTANATVCLGSSIDLTASAPVTGVVLMSQDFNSGLGSWAINNGLGLPGGFWQIVASSASVFGAGDGTPMLQADATASGGIDQTTLTSPLFSTIGYASASVSFNQTILSDVPDATATVEYSVNNGPWNALITPDYVGSFINPSAVWTAGSPEATIPLPADAIGQGNVRLRWRYDAAAYWWLLDNIVVSAVPPAATYTWAGATGLSCMNCANPTITPVAQGLNAYSVTATTSHNCQTTIPVTVSVNPVPSAIGGVPVVCEQSTTTLTNLAYGGTWTSNAPTTAFVAPASGVVTGVTAGTTTMTYTLNGGCYTTMDVTVNQTPLPLLGTKTVCAGLTTALSEALSGGTWSSNTVSVATISNTGVVTAVAQGTADVNYTMTATGCKTTATVTVYPTPATIAGDLKVCEGAVTALNNSLTGGTWTSGSANATIDPASGIANGITAGTAPITYTMGTGCKNTATLTVNVTPAPIAGTPAVCEGYSTALSNPTSVGIWTSTTANANVNGIGVVSGITAGTSTISYTLMTGCYATKEITVNTTPAPITGAHSVCEGFTTALNTSPAGGTWTSTLPGTAYIDPVSGMVSGIGAGTASVSYTLNTGCYAASYVTVNPTPAAVTGNASVCEGLTTPYSSATTGGMWSSNDGTVAMVDASGVVNGVVAGNATIIYTLPAGCSSQKAITVNPTPAALTGTFSVCEGAGTALASATTGGTWMSSDATAATVDATGNVSGLLAGNTNIVYTLPEGCTAAHAVTVNPSPAVNTGNFAVCEGLNTTLANTVAGGVWTSSDDAIATAGSASGVVTGVLAGNATMTYTLPAGCASMTGITVNPSPAVITGTTTICRGTTTTLNNIVTGGAWATSDPLVATVDAAGVVTAVAGGNATIDYTLPEGCTTNVGMTVNFVSEVYSVTGTGSYCNGGSGVSVGVSNTDLHSNYQLYNGATAIGAPVPGTGSAISFGPQTTAGTYTVVANPGTGCSTDMVGDAVVSINPLPVAFDVTGGGDYCSGTSGRHVGLFASQDGITYDLYTGGAVAATMAGSTAGGAIDFGSFTTTGTYTVQATNLATGCVMDMTQSASITMTPSVIPVVSLSQSVGSVICNGKSVTFTANATHGGLAPVYDWSVNGTAITGTGSTYTYVPANGDVVKTVLHSNEYCAIPDSAMATMTMSILPLVTPSISIEATPGNNVCKNTPVTYTSSSIHPGTVPHYKWVVNGIESGYSSSFSYTPLDGDIVYCMLSSNADCRLDTNVHSNNEQMTVDSGLVPIVDIRVLNGTAVFAGGIDTFIAVVRNGGNAPSFHWFVNGNPAPAGTGTSQMFSTKILNPKDSITVQVTADGACAYSTFNSVIIKTIAAGVAQAGAHSGDIRLIPNPNTGSFVVNGTLGTSSDEEVNLEITDMLGQVVYKGHTTAKGGNLNERIELSNTLANGMYMLNVTAANESKVFHFVLKQ